ncbi:MAG TPA: helix-turn-helix domain-containing protein [Panacibacter sp.]|nr:helix-turn-helix domain-containing protein [Panacibacter sp.]
MIFQKHIPKFPLCNYVDSILYIEGNNKGIGFPKTAMSIVFNLNDNFRLFTDEKFTSFIDYKKHWVAGFQTQPTYVESYGESKMVVIQFKTLGAYIFLNQPLKSFINHYITLDCIFKNEADEIWEQLKEADTINEMFLIAEIFMYRKLLTNKIPNEKLIASIDLLLNNKESISVTAICLKYNISRKHLNFLFQEYLGISPKTLSSLLRFQTVLQSISKCKPDSLTHFAYELDFFDQAHFNNNFKRFTGLKPNDYIKNVATQPTLKIVPHFLPIE